jgi:hypothetical protein
VVLLDNLAVANISNTLIFCSEWISEVDVKLDALVTPEALSVLISFSVSLKQIKICCCIA